MSLLSSSHAIFDLYRFQILPITRVFQPELFGGFKSLEELLERKNALFHDAVASADTFAARLTPMRHQMLAAGDDWLLIRFAVYRHLDRETPDFQHESLDNWPSFLAFIWSNPDYQTIAIERRFDAFQQTSSAANVIASRANVILQRANLRTHVKPRHEKRAFWKIVENNKDKIRAVRFTLVTPNMPAITATLDEQLKNLAKATNSAETEIALAADEASVLTLDKNDKMLEALVHAAEEGAAGIGIRLKGFRRTFETTEATKTVEVASIQAPDVKSLAEVLKQLIPK